MHETDYYWAYRWIESCCKIDPDTDIITYESLESFGFTPETVVEINKLNDNLPSQPPIHWATRWIELFQDFPGDALPISYNRVNDVSKL